MESKLHPVIEALESRIAPALLVYGANLLGGDSPLTGETSVGENSVTLVKVLAGRAMVWFDGFQITSISVGPGAKMEITGDVHGDIIANLTSDGSLSDSDNNPANGEDGGVLLPNDIQGIKFRPLGSEKGGVDNIVTGGSVSNIEVSGTINGIYAGDGAYRAESSLPFGGVITSGVELDINPLAPGIQDTFSLAKTDALFKAGASVSNLQIERGDNLQVFAGNGSPTGIATAGTAVAGGSISNVAIKLATVLAGSPVNTPSYYLLAGDGGNGKVGGAGGSISTIVESNSSGPVLILSGNGGNGGGGAGGNGGNIFNLDLQSASAQYGVSTGDGGNGTPGGAGGNISNSNFSNRTPVAGVIVSADFTGDGFDDILVADSGTGLMVLSQSNGAGGGYTQVVQKDATDVVIQGAGASPIDALATDFDGDGDLDAMVLYRDGTLAAFLNQKDGTLNAGVFYNATDEVFVTRSLSLGFTPTKFTQISPGSSVYAIAENLDGKGVLHGAIFDEAGIELRGEVFGGVLKFQKPIADVAGDFVGLNDGVIEQFQVVSTPQQSSLISVQKIAPAMPGGLDDLDVDAEHKRLLAVSSAGRSLVTFDISDTVAVALPVLSLSTLPGKPLSAKFIKDNDADTDDDIVVLSNSLDTAQVTLLEAPSAGEELMAHTIAAEFESDSLLKNFVAAYKEDTGFSLAALAGPLNKFTEISNFVAEQDYALPFASKQVAISTGQGGTGLDVGTKLGKGGAGGSMNNVNIDAQQITLTTGDGGNSTSGPAGAGGSIANSLQGSFKTAGGALVVPSLSAETSIQIGVGNGGTPLGAGGKTASGGAGGGISGLDMKLSAGQIELAAGSGGAGKGGVGGVGGTVGQVVIKVDVGGLVVVAGSGGAAEGGTANGGAGGGINNLKYDVTLDADNEKVENGYQVTLGAGTGGNSTGGIGGAGGDINDVSLKLDAAESTDPELNGTVDTDRDSTVVVLASAGNAGNGFKGGGAGGTIRNFASQSVHDQQVEEDFIINYFVLGLFAGNGGTASAGSGGAGGSVLLTKPISGVTFFDSDAVGIDPETPTLIVVGGSGGNGSTTGGAGGAVSGLIAQNSPTASGNPLSGTHLFSARVIGGDGGAGGTGNGGSGGSISKGLVGVSLGYLDVIAGDGGASANAKGGAGGTVTTSEFGLVSTFADLGMFVAAGDGGAGKSGGGVGGGLINLRLNTPQSTFNYAASLIAGDGGEASSATALGGKGGDINGITQAKDYNSSINVIQAGNGGANPLGKGGSGGNVTNVRTVGFIGRPSDGSVNLGVFDGGAPQGIFAGRGGDGATDGVNGSISNIVARQIAAMAAAMDSSGLFAAAMKISNVKASLIGFDADGDGAFDTEGAVGASPSGTVPVDGFILATALSKVTGSRPAFTFTA